MRDRSLGSKKGMESSENSIIENSEKIELDEGLEIY